MLFNVMHVITISSPNPRTMRIQIIINIQADVALVDTRSTHDHDGEKKYLNLFKNYLGSLEKFFKNLKDYLQKDLMIILLSYKRELH